MQFGRWQGKGKNEILKKAHIDYNNRELHKHMRTTHHIHLKDQDKNVF